MQKIKDKKYFLYPCWNVNNINESAMPPRPDNPHKKSLPPIFSNLWNFPSILIGVSDLFDGLIVLSKSVINLIPH